jgi:type IV pilus assembly protein PilQ
MRIMRRAWGLAAVIAAGLIVMDGALPAAESPVVHVKATVGQQDVRLEAQANAPFEYTAFRPSASLYVLDLSGVSAADPVGARVVSSDLIKGYREIAYSVGSRPMVRLEVLLSQGLEPRVERTGSESLTLLVSRVSASAPVGEPAALKMVASKPAEVAPVASGVQRIRQVLLSEKDGSTQVNILASGKVEYHTLRLHNPDRLVLDFESSQLRTPAHHIASNLDPVREIRLAQFKPDVSRVVIDLREAAPYNVTSAGHNVTVAFGPHSGPANSEPARKAARVLVAANAKPDVPAPQGAWSTSVPAPAALLPASLTRTSAFAAPLAPQQEVAADATKMAHQAAAASPAGTTPTPKEPAPAAVPASPAGNAPTASDDTQVGPGMATRYSGEPISVNLKDVDLRDFFRLIHEVSGLNVVVDPAVKGSLTIVLDDVPWDQALDIVLRNNDLDKQLDGNVLRIATKATIKKEAEENRDLAKAQAEAADVVTTTRVLSYAKATDLATTLKKFLSSRGEILADERSNTLIIRDVPSVFPVIDNLLRQLDRKSRQVEIEARVVAANRSFDREFGSLLGASGRIGNGAAGGANGVGATPITNFTPAPPIYVGSGGTGAATSGAAPLLTNLGSSVPTSGIQYAFQSTNFALDAVLDALEEKGVGKLLSKPKIFTQNNQKGTIKQGTKIPVQTIINNTVSVQFVDAVLELDVTPQITADGTIYMDVTVENDQIDQSIPRVEGIPAIDTQSAQTRVTVKDGATVVIGGIIVSTQRTDVQQVPLLGSVPIIGNLFKHSTVNSSQQELLFFLTPRILPG